MFTLAYFNPLQFRQWGKVEGAWEMTAGICARTSTNWWREARVAMREDSEAPASLRSNLIGICSEGRSTSDRNADRHQFGIPRCG